MTFDELVQDFATKQAAVRAAAEAVRAAKNALDEAEATFQALAKPARETRWGFECLRDAGVTLPAEVLEALS